MSSVYADNSNTYNSNQTYNVKGVVNYNKGTVDNSEQYELTIKKDSNMTNTHVELLPDNDGKYWIPKGYKVKVTADCKDGYEQSNNIIQTVNDTTTINLASTEAPPSRMDELEEQFTALQKQMTTLSENGTSPTGTIISVMANNAPMGYLPCDGATYNIKNYPQLAEHLKTEFGSINYFGRNGVTTFQVPDLRGEFLRGTGTNGHANQGNGGTVGKHQNATIQVRCGAYGSAPKIFAGFSLENMAYYDWYSSVTEENSGRYATEAGLDLVGGVRQYTSRPTNTSVLYCIKY